jgi:O-antigen biosynthesis protein
MPRKPQFNPLDYPVTLLEPILATQDSAWLEHIPLAYLLIDLLQPTRAVELGVHFGDSYCAFCQAVDHLKLPTRMFGIDTWRGDKHAGSYGAEVLALLRRHHDPRYARFSTLMPMEFDSALSHFADASVDLLHIDGFHTYDAVKHDFETWLPKMSYSGVVLFHDTQDRTGDFGVYKLWAELVAKYPHFEFTHGPGMGILAVGAEVPVQLLPMLIAAPADADAIRAFYARLGREISLRRFLTQIMRTVFKAQSAINDWKLTTGQSVSTQSQDIRVAMNHSLSFAQMLVADVEGLVRSDIDHRL